jgi:hypothetical protein
MKEIVPFTKTICEDEETGSEQSICVRHAEYLSKLTGEQSVAPTVLRRWNPWLECYEEVKK